MRKLDRSAIVDYVTYSESRDALRKRVLEIKRPRRIHLGEHLTFLFENTDTVRYQVQEMMRTEQIVREVDIQHEIATYNELLGGEGEIGCCLLIEIDDESTRDRLLREWVELPHHLYARREDGSKAPATFDPRQIGRGRLSSVQYLKFAVGTAAPTALGSDLPGLEIESELSPEQRRALGADLLSEA